MIIIPDAMRRPAEVERDELRKQLAKALAEIEEHHELVRMCHKRTVEADKLWQKAHNKPDVWPDLGVLIEWLINEKKSAEQRAAETRTTLKSLYAWVQAEADHFGANTPDDDMIEAVEEAIK